MIDTVLHLQYLHDDMAIFMGDSEETTEIIHPFFGKEEKTLRFPCFQISRDDWEQHGCPTVIRIVITNVTQTFHQ